MPHQGSGSTWTNTREPPSPPAIPGKPVWLAQQPLCTAHESTPQAREWCRSACQERRPTASSRCQPRLHPDPTDPVP
uniref:Uncharacterized protein n=1 Tax=Mustela putorius furo TaxID=9669 RepID=M3Y255_MUSPF